MKFTPLEIPGCFVIEVEPVSDDRGFFARTWCKSEFAEHGLTTDLAQCSVSFNIRKGTLRGMHYQAQPKAEVKLVRCTRGAIYDVLLDLRPESSTYLKWTASELSAENHRMFYIPEGVAHGFQTLEDSTEVFYMISEFYDPALSRGVRWNDAAFKIEWPEAAPTISERDKGYPDYDR